MLAAAWAVTKQLLLLPSASVQRDRWTHDSVTLSATFAGRLPAAIHKSLACHANRVARLEAAS